MLLKGRPPRSGKIFSRCGGCRSRRRVPDPNRCLPLRPWRRRQFVRLSVVDPCKRRPPNGKAARERRQCDFCFVLPPKQTEQHHQSGDSEEGKCREGFNESLEETFGKRGGLSSPVWNLRWGGKLRHGRYIKESTLACKVQRETSPSVGASSLAFASFRYACLRSAP